MGYDGQGIGKRTQGILIPIIDTPWVKHKGLCFDGILENSMTMKTTFVKDKDMSKLAFSLEERTVIQEWIYHSGAKFQIPTVGHALHL
jgi:hypothetical protein